MSTDGDEDRSAADGRELRCEVCRQIFRTCHDPSVVHCPTCGSGDVEPVSTAE